MSSDGLAPSAPRDGGLSGLSLVMQFTGRFLFWLALAFAVQLFFLPSGGSGWWLTFGFVVCALRSHLHLKAGQAVITADSRPVRDYLIFSALQTSAVALAVAVEGRAPGLALAVAALLGWWPLMVWALVRRAEGLLTDRAAPEQRLPSDRGLTGLALSMGVMATMCALATGAALAFWVNVVSPLPGNRWVWLMVMGAFALIFIRSLFHFWAAVTLLRGFDLPRFFRARERYFFVSVVASGLTVIVLAVSSAQLDLLVGALPHLGVVLAWPVLVRDFGVVTSGPVSTIPQGLTRPADGGLGTLAVLLLASGGLGLALWLLGGVLNSAMELAAAKAPPAFGAGSSGWLKTALFTEPALLACGWCLLTGHVRRMQVAWLTLGLFVLAGAVNVAVWLRTPVGVALGIGPSSNTPEFLAASVLVPLVLPAMVLWQLRRVDRTPAPPGPLAPPVDLAKR